MDVRKTPMPIHSSVYSRNSDSTLSSNKISRQKALIISIIAIILGYLFGDAMGPILSSHSRSTASTTTTQADSIITTAADSIFDEPKIKFYNNYTISRPYTTDYPWAYIVEPYRKTYFYVHNPIDESLLAQNKLDLPEFNSKYVYEWYVDGWYKASGSSVDMTFASPPGRKPTIEVKLKYYNTQTNEVKIVSSSSINVIIKYVRREIRELFDNDREAMFNTISIIQRVPTQTGKKLFGKNYRSKDFFNRIHLYYGGSKSCDHWHQGPGFVTSHLAFEIMYEKAMQSIDPSVSLPYWDFTLESTFYTPPSFRSSGVFSDDWFGDARCNSSLHTPTTGRFQFVPTMKNAQNYSTLYSPYGLLRSPWNTDPTPYMTRSDKIYGLDNNLKPSGCYEYYHALQYNDWTNIAKQLNTNAHGHIHELMGGSWNPKYKVSVSKDMPAYTEAYQFMHSTEAHSKLLWRFGYLNCPDSIDQCDKVDSKSGEEIDCQCKCIDFQAKGISLAQVLDNTNIIKSLVFYDKEGNAITNWQDKKTKLPYETLPGYTFQETQDIYSEIMKILCQPGHIGDMFQATSTNDVTFWVLHPTLDRLWHRMRLNHRYGLVSFDNTWDDNAISCHGHYSYSTTPFKNLFDNNDVVYTNAELFKLLDPSLDSFPFIYEHFRWSHCTQLGARIKFFE